MAGIELRLTNVDPPTPEPKRTIYRDIVNLPDPVKLGITIRYFNNDDVGLYMQITGSGTGYTFGTVNLGLLASGADAYRNLDEFASRAKPSAETTENITLTLKGYTDSGYTDLKWTYNRTVTVQFINSADPSYTQDVLNNFDDGTNMGWAALEETGAGSANLDGSPVTDYVLSAPYALRMGVVAAAGAYRIRGRLYKSFTTPNRDTVYAIIDIRLSVGAAGRYTKYVQIQRDATPLVFLGRSFDSALENYVPQNKWMRIVVPLPKNTTFKLRIVHDAWQQTYGYYNYLHLDDFKIISK